MYRARSKYKNSKRTVNGETFDSQKEMHRYSVLKLLEERGQISDLKRQVKYVLIPAQRAKSTEVYKSGARKGQPKEGKLIEREVAYYADFVYINSDGEKVVEDVKSPITRTKDYIIKRKLMLYIHGIQINEV